LSKFVTSLVGIKTLHKVCFVVSLAGLSLVIPEKTGLERAARRKLDIPLTNVTP